MYTPSIDELNRREKERGRQMKELRKASGGVKDNTRLVSFLYDLMRDHLPAGTVQRLVMDAQELPVEFTNGYLAKYAKYLAKRLK